MLSATEDRFMCEADNAVYDRQAIGVEELVHTRFLCERENFACER